MSQDPKVLIVDEGELRLARVLLNQLGAAFSHVRGDMIAGPLPEAQRLLVVPAQLAVSLRLSRTRPKDGASPMWLAFVRDDSRSQRRLLRQAGFDFTVPMNVHPSALRLLIGRALFEGESTQRVLRVPYGAEVGYVSGLWKHQAIMVDVSPRGCRLLTPRPTKVGAKVTVQIPTSDRALLQLSGEVVRVGDGRRSGGQATDRAVGICFDSITGKKRDQLKQLLTERLSGPLTFGQIERSAQQSGRGVERAPVPPIDLPESPDLLDEDEETPTVGRFERQVDAFCAGATRVLVGRDLSPDGMRIEKRNDLKVGERLRLALPVGDRSAPLIIESHVARDEADGFVLLFDWMEPADKERLAELTRKLPKIHQLEEDTRTHTAIPAAVVSTKKS